MLETTRHSAFPFAVVGASPSEACPKCGGKLLFEDKNTMSGEDIREYRCSSCGESKFENRGSAFWYMIQESNKEETIFIPTEASRVRGDSVFKRNMTVVLIGSAFAGLGAWVIYNFGYLPWDEATRAVPNMNIDIKALIIGPIALVLGLGLLLSLALSEPNGDFGSPAPTRAILAKVIVLIAVAAIIAGIASYFWLRSFLRDRGYVV